MAKCTRNRAKKNVKKENRCENIYTVTSWWLRDSITCYFNHARVEWNDYCNSVCECFFRG